MELDDARKMEALIEDMRGRGLLPGFFSGWGAREWRGILALGLSTAGPGAFLALAIHVTGLPRWALWPSLAILALASGGMAYSYLRWCQRRRELECVGGDLLQILRELPPAEGPGAGAPDESA